MFVVVSGRLQEVVGLLQISGKSPEGRIGAGKAFCQRGLLLLQTLWSRGGDGRKRGSRVNWIQVSEVRVLSPDSVALLFFVVAVKGSELEMESYYFSYVLEWNFNECDEDKAVYVERQMHLIRYIEILW